MFVLTCPNCEHETRCKYARSGAVASCPSCKATFDLTEYTLRVEKQAEDLFAPWKPKPAETGVCDEAPALLQQLSEASAPVRRSSPRRRRRRVDAAIVSLNLAAALIVGVAVWWALRVSGVWAGPSPAIAAPVEPGESTEAVVPGEPLPSVQFEQK